MGTMLFSYVSHFILDDVYGVYAFLVCIKFYTGRCVYGLCFSCMYPILILDDVYGAYAFLVCIPFLYWMMCMGRMLFPYVAHF